VNLPPDLPLNLLLLSALILVAATAAITWLVFYIVANKKTTALQQKITELQTRLTLEQKNFADKIKDRDDLAALFGHLSSEALKSNNDTFLKLAQEKLKQFQISAQNNLTEKEKAISALLEPVRDALSKTERQIQEIEKERKHSFGALSQQIKSLAEAQESLQSETRNLVTALRRPEVRGKWGELTLKRVVELAGMVEHCDFDEQQQVGDDDRQSRPDMLVNLPDERQIVVDAKTPLDAYLNAIEAQEESVKQLQLERHARNLRERVKELASKAYWNALPRTPDFVVLFIPGEQFLSAALQIDKTLLEDGLKQKVIIATPTTLVALLRAVAYGWRQQSLEKNAEQVRQLGEALYKRLATFTEHLSNLGDRLSATVSHYNKAVGSLERQVLPGARKMEELGIEAKKKIDSPEPVDQALREPARQPKQTESPAEPQT